MEEQKVYEELRRIRKERGLTLNQLAEQIGTDHQSISRLERGKSRLTLEWLMKITKALNMSVSEFGSENVNL